MRRPYAATLLLVASLVPFSTPGSAAESHTIWQVGSKDSRDDEFALAPGGYRDFRDDAFFVIGSANPKQHWPYVQPGPGDSWAGGRQHTSLILFGLKAQPATGTCRLVLDFLDTHSSSPPRIRVLVNGHAFEKTLPKGGGDESISGDLSKARASSWEIKFPSSALHAGDNEVSLTTLAGSWLIYDSLRLESSLPVEIIPVTPRTLIVSAEVPPVWVKEAGGPKQPVKLTLRHIGEGKAVQLQAGPDVAQRLTLKNGQQAIELNVSPAEQPRELSLKLIAEGQVLAFTNLTLRAPPIRELWLLPHSHVDIGYTHRQDEVIGLQIQNLEKGIELARLSATNPPGMRFKWNPEAVWTLDHYLQRANATQRAAFIQAVQAGQVGVDALYGNLLTGLCRPEELAQGLAFGARLSEITGRSVVSASICDVPGYTWGIVPLMAQAGVKYFAIGPNYGDRVGTIHLWDNKPFYWKSQSGRDRVLCWVVDNYHFLGDLEQNVLPQLGRLQRSGFPFETTFLFWVGQWPNGGVDNAPPDDQIANKVLAWNEKYAAPRVVIGLVGEFFREFERKHGAQLPEFAGDLTPYWEDGAGSTAAETALNRQSADRLSQAETVFAIRGGKHCPTERINAAWKNALLYSEHTWGAWCSISKPDDAFTLDQWRVKQGFALAADQQSRELLAMALAPQPEVATGVDVYNTTQWPRTDLAIVPARAAGPTLCRVTDEHGRTVPSQRATSGELVFLAKDVPAYGTRRFRLSEGACAAGGDARAANSTLENRLLRVEVDPASGAIRSLRLKGLKHEFVDLNAPVGLNDFRYVLGTNSLGALSNGPVTISVLEPGPLVATLRIESEAPGCNRLVRDVRVRDGVPWVECVDLVDRKSVREKDGVHFGFGLNVPEGTVRMETPWAVVRPNVDQLQGSCRNWFTVQRWVDVSNSRLGVSWASLDAPLVELGGLSANLLGSVDFHEWMTNAPDSQTLYSWAQNNHWHTNYKIDQPGCTTFRYLLWPHTRGYSSQESARFGLETSRPLVVNPVRDQDPSYGPLLKVSSADVLVETLKVSDDGRAFLVRLFGVSGKNRSVELNWKGTRIASTWLSDLSQKPLRKLGKRIEVPAYDVVTVRAEME